MSSWYHKHKEAVSFRRKQRVERNRVYLDTVKQKSGGCSVCGIKILKVLKFVHVDDVTKEYEVNDMVNNAMSIESIDKEIDKCTLMCLNCLALTKFT